jgi:hypothetical protein
VIDSLDIFFHGENSSIASTTIDAESSASDTLSDTESILDDEDDKPTEPKDAALVSSDIIPDQAEYPLLSSFVSLHNCHNIFDCLLNEIVRCYNRSDITFKHGKNIEATLIAVPSFWSLSRYEKELKKKKIL